MRSISCGVEVVESHTQEHEYGVAYLCRDRIDTLDQLKLTGNPKTLWVGLHIRFNRRMVESVKGSYSLVNALHGMEV
jgi:hypothetical protein